MFVWRLYYKYMDTESQTAADKIDFPKNGYNVFYGPAHKIVKHKGSDELAQKPRLARA